MKRKIVHIDESKCNGCELCVSACHEGAIQMRDGKAELVSDIYCDGLGDCLGECPTGAITIEDREAVAFDAAAVASRQAEAAGSPPAGGCPGMRALTFGGVASAPPASAASNPVADLGRSHLRQWPVQLHLVPVQAPWWDGSDILLAADCVAVALPDFQGRLLQGRSIAIACPKLDDTSEYVGKLAAILAGNDVKRLTVVRMHVPCCGGIVHIAEAAMAQSGKDVPMEVIVVDHTGAMVESAF